MKKFILISIFIALPTVSFAHADHAPKVATCVSKECVQDEIKSAVPKAVEILVAKGKIEGSWSAAMVEKIEQRTFKKGPEWVAILVDEKQQKKRLYIFITLKGYLNGANFTGE